MSRNGTGQKNDKNIGKQWWNRKYKERYEAEKKEKKENKAMI